MTWFGPSPAPRPDRAAPEPADPGAPDRDDVAAVRAGVQDLRRFVEGGGYGPGPRSGRRPGARRRRLALLDELLEQIEARMDLVDLQRARPANVDLAAINELPDAAAGGAA